MPIPEQLTRRTFVKRMGQLGGLLIAGGSLGALEAACANLPANFRELLTQNEGKEMPLPGVSRLQRVNPNLAPVLIRVSYFHYGAANVVYNQWEERDILAYEWKGTAPTRTGGGSERIRLFEYVDENLLATNQSEGKLDWLFQKKALTTAVAENPQVVINLDGFSLATFLPTQTAEQAASVTGNDMYLVSSVTR